MAERSGWVPESGGPDRAYPPGFGPADSGMRQQPPVRADQPVAQPAWSYPGPPLPPLPVEPAPRRRGPVVKVVIAAAVAVVCLIVAVLAGSSGEVTLTRKPTAAELSAAAALAVAQRWERWPAGQIFPSGIGYSTSLLTQETANRVGIAATTTCPASLDHTLATLAMKDGCRAALRAAYVDELGGVVYTVGVLAFADPRDSQLFLRRIPAQSYPATGLQALALPGTPAARFDDAARQASDARQAGPYIVLAVAGYVDGRPAAAGDERRASVFTPISQLVSSVATPLGQPATVNCAMRTQWEC